LKTPDRSPAAALLASPDSLQVVWLHLFAAGNPPGPRSAWEALWPPAAARLSGMGLPAVWSMTTHDWLIDRLKGSGFIECGRVVAYDRHLPAPETHARRTTPAVPLRETDLPSIERLDLAAFAPPWQMDSEALRETLRRSIFSAVIRRRQNVVGYLMASPTARGVHLTRLAVHPDEQNRGVGRELLTSLVNHCREQGAARITVNTQIENRRSQRLYRSLNFSETGDSYPVFRFDLARAA
jgi:ribosomal protein S18 acetylase RimI-like enzyme